LFLRNRTLIPVGWRLSGLENLGDDFSVSQDNGVVAPNTEFALQAHFRATKPVITNRKSIRLEVQPSDLSPFHSFIEKSFQVKILN